MPAGLKGALLGFGNPLLDISAGARSRSRAAAAARHVALPQPRGRAACGPHAARVGARGMRSAAPSAVRQRLHLSSCN
jgi:hypothetical protein